MSDLYIDQASRELSLETLKRLMSDHGAERLFFKRLAGNDNSKNQIYLGGTPEDTRPIPTGEWSRAVLGTSGKGKGAGTRYILQAPVALQWLSPQGTRSPAPLTKLILYPQYSKRGEFRLSGFLQGAREKPSSLLNGQVRGREPGRIAFFGVSEGRPVLGFIAPSDSRIARELATEPIVDKVGVLEEIKLLARSAIATREELLEALGDVHRLGWTDSKLLSARRGVLPCTGNQCVGQTLQAELGVSADGRAVPDYRGWELKAFTLGNFVSKASRKVTLMTPEPTGGYYRKHGAAGFLAKYGLPSKDGTKIYFEGTHKYGVPHSRRRTVLAVSGYDTVKGAITDASGGIQLLDFTGAVAAEWDFAGLVQHWRDKHARAVFVPAMHQTGTPIRYCYADYAHLATGNPFVLFVGAFLSGSIFYDPGIRMAAGKEGGSLKARNQFRISVPAALGVLYENVELRAPVI